MYRVEGRDDGVAVWRWLWRWVGSSGIDSWSAGRALVDLVGEVLCFCLCAAPDDVVSRAIWG